MGFSVKTNNLTALLLFLTLCLTLLTPLTAIDQQPSVYEVLESYDFPLGLLPKGVTGYELDPTTGRFSAYLNGSCSFSLEDSYQLRYKSTIKGSISNGKLKDLSGVSVKILLFWVDIVEVDRSGDELTFSVGIAWANFGVENFEEQPQCGCGLNCNGVEKEVKGVGMIGRRSPFVDSS
ncbi:hypothetical protein GIB67_022924 [Kingdonia uniflora]|uniref:Uncharacterized protein n=1 Tax=Kingdonia uniflora TaxID=39325 RepID=A0A7J7P2B0_9MAGN|nr:hypothetical protein GIB67_022924 [Kingdonia uniflora]